MADRSEGLSATGTIVTGVSRNSVPAAFEGVLRAAIEEFDAHPERRASASLHLYGSVATGQARPGSSDVDLLTVGLPEHAASEVGGMLTDRFAPLCRSVDIAAGPASGLEGETDEVYGNRVFLRHYCLLLAGPDPVDRTSEFEGDRRAARGFNGDIARHLDRWRMGLAAGAEPAALARTVSRKTLLAVAGLVSVHDHTWTTDRVGAATRWSEIDPVVARGVETLVAWMDAGSGATNDQIGDALDGPVGAIVAAFERTIGLWE
jgi:predicted nucleotidyltransferase